MQLSCRVGNLLVVKAGLLRVGKNWGSGLLLLLRERIRGWCVVFRGGGPGAFGACANLLAVHLSSSEVEEFASWRGVGGLLLWLEFGIKVGSFFWGGWLGGRDGGEYTGARPRKYQSSMCTSATNRCTCTQCGDSGFQSPLSPLLLWSTRAWSALLCASQSFFSGEFFSYSKFWKNKVLILLVCVTCLYSYPKKKKKQ